MKILCVLVPLALVTIETMFTNNYRMGTSIGNRA